MSHTGYRNYTHGGKYEMSLINEIKDVLNKHNTESCSNTPDFILAEYLITCLGAFDKAVNDRSEWYGNPEYKDKQK